MKVAASPRSMAQVAAVLAFVISHTTFLAAQDDETGRCPKIFEKTLPASSAFPAWGRQRGGGFAAKKKANPASLRSAAPSKGRGSRGYSLLPMEGGAPKGRRLDGESGMKKSEENRLKCVVYESTLSTAARSPFPNGEGCDTRIPLLATQRLFQGGKVLR